MEDLSISLGFSQQHKNRNKNEECKRHSLKAEGLTVKSRRQGFNSSGNMESQERIH
jgi:hypothetical protein